MNIDHIGTLLERLAAFTTTPADGCTRLSYSPQLRAACRYVAERAEALGLHVHLDAVGNLHHLLQVRRLGESRGHCQVVCPAGLG